MASLSASPSVSVTVSPKITSIQDGAKFARDFVRNPPTDPVQALKVMGSTLNVGGALSAGLTAVFPLAAPLLPVLGGIFDLFGGGGPDLGEILGDAINQVSQQIDAGFKAVQAQIAEVSHAEASRTIDTVLSGVDDIARQQSAASVIENFSAQGILSAKEAEKAAAFADYTDTVNAARQKFIDDVKAAVTKSQAEADAQYRVIQAQVLAIAGDVLGPMQKALDAAAAEADELLDIEKQLAEIREFMIKNSHDDIAKMLIMQYTGKKL